MNIYEGITRLTRIFRWIGNGSAALLASLGVFNFLADSNIGALVGFTLMGVAAYAIFHATAWVLDGFVSPKS